MQMFCSGRMTAVCSAGIDRSKSKSVAGPSIARYNFAQSAGIVNISFDGALGGAGALQPLLSENVTAAVVSRAVSLKPHLVYKYDRLPAVLSRKSKYGLKALLILAQEAGRGPVLISALADREAIPKKFLEAILLELKRHGVVHSRKGKGGGYFLRRRPSE